MKILLAIDDSPYSKTAANEVARRPWPRGTTVRILNAVERFVPPAAELWYDASGDLEEAREQVKKRAKKLVARVAKNLRENGLTVETAVSDGDPRTVIIDEAKKWNADLIVVGSHGRTGLTRLLLGSVAQAIVAHGPCSIEVVREKLKA